MDVSRLRLYPTIWRLVIPAVLGLGLFWTIAPAQVGKAVKPYPGPRALGLLELWPNGKAHLIPITILLDGKFYDASAYKAAPVPMALYSDTVYEALRTGVSQGLFTVTAALEKKDNSSWIAEGTWQAAGSIPAKQGKKTKSSEPRGLEQDEGPPVLRHSQKPKPPEPTTEQTAAPQTAPAQGSPTQSTSPAASPPPGGTAEHSAATSSAPQPDTGSTSSTTAAAVPEDKTPEDKDRPTLHRGKPATKPLTPIDRTVVAPSPKPAKPTAAPSAADQKSQAQLIPAISDAGGPEPRPYTFNLTPAEELQFRKKMLALAADEVRSRARQLASQAVGAAEPAHNQRRTAAAKPVQPEFDDVQLRVFDLSSNNEPVLVVTAEARLPHRSDTKENPNADFQYMVTLVAREDVNGDFHKAFANVTDAQHLDVTPRVDLIDAVDVDGDGRGELLFRQVSDAGSAFVVYRVIGNQLYPLFQGAPSE